MLGTAADSSLYLRSSKRRWRFTPISNVFEIGHACSAREDLSSTTETIVSAVEKARLRGGKTICFVTGVPGAGKTLVGLNAVHRSEIRQLGSFLSGNGPLLKVLQEALLRDATQTKDDRRSITRRDAALQVQTFVHNVHRFADQYYREEQKCPAQNVIVFDEAQRAWDAEQNKRAKRPPVSEARMMLEVMDRRKDWAVIVALIGGTCWRPPMSSLGTTPRRAFACSKAGRRMARFKCTTGCISEFPPGRSGHSAYPTGLMPYSAEKAQGPRRLLNCFQCGRC